MKPAYESVPLPGWPWPGQPLPDSSAATGVHFTPGILERMSLKGVATQNMKLFGTKKHPHLLPELSLCHRWQIEKQRVWGEGEKNSFIALPGKGGAQQANALKTVHPPGRA